jgi:prolyl-tRNA editing enzyme YbaK/EbsC (Cys-tRNA(Pro) deacylase)
MTDGDDPGAPGWHANVDKVLAAARAAGLSIEIRRFPEGTRTAADAARAVGCDVSQIVKSLVFVAGERPVLALVSGADRADPDRLSAALAADGSSALRPIRRATAGEAREATGFAIGGIPPLGHVRPLTILIDQGLLRHDVVWAAAGLPDAVFAVSPDLLARAAGARVAAIATGDPSAR